MNSLSRWWMLLLVPVLLMIAFAFVTLTTDEQVTAEDLSRQAEEAKQRLLDASVGGGTLYRSVESFERDRINPEPLIPSDLHLPDRIVEETSFAIDDAGTMTPQGGAVFDVRGEVLATISYDGRTRVFTHPDSEASWRMELPFADLEADLPGWLAGAVVDPSPRLRDLGMEAAGSSTLAGEESVVFDRVFVPDESNERRVRQEHEFQRDNPLISRAAVYEIAPDGGETLTSEMIIHDVRIE